MQVRFGQNALGQAVADGRQPQGAADIERQIADAVTEGQQRFDGRERAVAAGRGEIGERIGELLQVGRVTARSGFPAPGRKRSTSAR